MRVLHSSDFAHAVEVQPSGEEAAVAAGEGEEAGELRSDPGEAKDHACAAPDLCLPPGTASAAAPVSDWAGVAWEELDPGIARFGRKHTGWGAAAEG